MKIWLSKNSEVPVREQLSTQIILGVVSGDLAIGERLPSTREIARRFGVHSNTVSHAYQSLAEQGWLEFQKGSGFYVCREKPESFENSLDEIIAEFFQTAQKQGFSTGEIKARLSRFFEIQPPENIFVIESDTGLREILVEEIRQATNFEVESASFESFQNNHHQANSIFVAMFDETAKVGSVLSSNKTSVFLKARSVSDSMKDEKRPTRDDLIAVVSGWERFLEMAKTMLVAAGIEPDTLLIRSTEYFEWRKGLSAATMIICDYLTAKNFPNDARVRPFRVISDESLSYLKRLCEEN